MHGRGKKQPEENIIKSTRNLFKLKKEKKASKDRINRDIRILFEQEDDYHKPIRVGNFWSNSYINIKVVAIEKKPISKRILR